MLFEITLVGNECDEYYLSLLEDRLSALKPNICFALSNFNGKVYYSIATDSKSNADIIKDQIAEKIIRLAKYEFFAENLPPLSSSKKLNDYIYSRLVSLGLNDEVIELLKNMKFKKELHIRPFIKFHLKEFIRFWEGIVAFFEEFITGKSDIDIYIRFLRMLYRNIKPKTKVIFLDYIEDKFFVREIGGEIYKSVDFENMMHLPSILATAQAEKIVVNCAKALSDDLLSYLRFIFGENLNLLY